MTQIPTPVLIRLLAEHEELREIMADIESVADELDAGRVEPAALSVEVVRLRVAFDAHTSYEQQLGCSVLHVDEHRAVGVGLGHDIIGELRQTLERLRHHLESEERAWPLHLRDAWLDQASTSSPLAQYSADEQDGTGRGPRERLGDAPQQHPR